MKSKIVIRALLTANLAFWVVGFYFPFPRYFTTDQMRSLSYRFADLSIAFPALLLIVGIIALWSHRKALVPFRIDLGLAFLAVPLNIFLMTKV